MDLAGKALKLHIIRHWLNSYHKIVKIENSKILIWVLITVLIEKKSHTCGEGGIHLRISFEKPKKSEL